MIWTNDISTVLFDPTYVHSSSMFMTISCIWQVTGDGEDKYLIATSEQPLCAYHLGDRIYPADLPIRWAMPNFS
jgi:seryl-tRNA synthetase